MTTKSTKPDRQLRKLKLTLAAGGLITTLMGAGLLGSQAEAAAGAATHTTTAVPATTAVPSSTDTTLPADLDLNLEAVPTVAAPTFRQMAVARGRSSG
ncbi:MAG: hypothetical protein H6659_11510 [Ardenticatenaceae bacterium]|nr:hypothetical protein [Ardenticatenaceae bacterium]